MMVVSLQTEKGVMTVVGVTEEDRERGQLEAIDFERNFQIGLPLPRFVQIVFVKDNDDLADRLRAVVPDLDENLVDLPPVPEE
jgi:hypothetical protein